MFPLLPLILAVLVRAQGPIQTLFPAAIPLAIRSPYLSAWQNTTIGSSPLGSAWPLFWTESVRTLIQAGVWIALTGVGDAGNPGMAGDRQNRRRVVFVDGK